MLKALLSWLFSNGDWAFNSGSDPRWNSSGRGRIDFYGPHRFGCLEASVKFTELTKEYGDPPVDLHYLVMKD